MANKADKEKMLEEMKIEFVPLEYLQVVEMHRE